MTRLLLALIPATLSLTLLSAGAADFVPPQAYPKDRFEQGWQKNPFTLKTAPPAVQRESFAKDLALGSISGSEDNPTVVLVNTKTRERTPIHGTEPDSNGMKIRSIHSDCPRKDRYVELELAGEVAEIRFDEKLISASSATAQPGQPNNGGAGNPANRAGMRPGGPGAAPMNNTNPGQPLPGQSGLGAVNNGVAPVNIAKGPRTTPNYTPPPLNNALPAGVNVPTASNQPAAAGIDSAPVVQRRRFITVPQPATPAP